jgi:threonine synthase
MDVGNPSNFARILALYGTPEEMRKHIIGCGYTDPETEGAILELFQKYGYVADPHGAIGYLGLRDFLRETSDSFAGIFLETADPAKFPECLKRVLNMDVEPPSPLKEALSREKHSVRLSTRYEDFRSFLLGM